MDILLHAFIFQVLIGTIAAYKEEITYHGTTGQLLVALNTPSPFWMIKRSYNISKHSCVYAEMKFLNNSHYYFTQYYLEDNMPRRQELYATIAAATKEEGTGGVTLTVHNPKAPSSPGRRYLLLHWDPQNHCGFLSFRNNSGHALCEMYAWNEDAGDALEKCATYYSIYCQNSPTEQVVYNKDYCKAQLGC
uniref:Lipocalin n=1 Tax=Rhipicephalus appendiculatus TaxID=34631 RepID=A0A131YT20_RHIAP